MCGFIGGNLFAGRSHAFESLATIEHRGRDSKPDVQWVANDFLFGHNRLSIQDLSDLADQPMTVGDITIVYNGELWENTIDKYDALLRSKYDFSTTNSDTELLIYMYIEYGLEMFDRIDGMYSFALYDGSKEQIILGRDWVGRLPFYYIENYKKVAFASEYKALSETFYNNSVDIKIMPPSHYYIWDLYESRFIEKKQYYDIRKNICKSDTEEEVVKSEIFNRLFEAVQNELIADVKLCTILSGGIDSVIITYFLKMLIPDIKSYVVNVGRGKNKDDLYYAKMAAEWLDIELEEVHVSKTQINQKLSESIWASESKVWHQVSPAVAQLFLSKKISKDGYKVVFGGEGADKLMVRLTRILAIVFMVLAVGIADSVHIIAGVRYYLRKDLPHEKALEESFKKSATSIALTSFTTMAGLSSLAFSPVVPIRVFALFAALGVLSHYLFIYLLAAMDVFFLYMIIKKRIDYKCLISLVPFLLVLIPHLIWLIENNYITITYAFHRTGLNESTSPSYPERLNIQPKSKARLTAIPVVKR